MKRPFAAVAPIVALTAALLTVTGTAFATQGEPPQSSTKKSKSKPSRAVGAKGALSPLQRQLQSNPSLADRLTERLPRSFDAVSASSGFRNLGEFVAAINAANNLQIPFVTLKSRMIDDRMSLGQAIRNLRPSANSRAEVRRAERQAAALLRK